MAGWLQCVPGQEFVEHLFLWVWQRALDLVFNGRTEITSVSDPDTPRSLPKFSVIILKSIVIGGKEEKYCVFQ